MDPIYRNGNKHPANGQHFGKKIMLTPSLKRGTNPVQKYIGKFPCCQWSARYWKLKSFHLTNHLNKNHLSTRQYGFQKNLSADWSAAFHHGQRTCVLAPDIEESSTRSHLGLISKLLVPLKYYLDKQIRAVLNGKHCLLGHQSRCPTRMYIGSSIVDCLPEWFVPPHSWCQSIYGWNPFHLVWIQETGCRHRENSGTVLDRKLDLGGKWQVSIAPNTTRFMVIERTNSDI